MNETDFLEFPKMARFSRDCVITEKIDGTNAQILITNELVEGLSNLKQDPSMIPMDSNIIAKVDGFTIRAGSRSKWITPGKSTDNYGFAQWVKENAEELVKLGEGRHFGEWWGKGIQRGYSTGEKRFSLFNTERWSSDELRPKCCHVAPVLWEGSFNEINCAVDDCIHMLVTNGSYASPGFMKPEGIVIYHKAGNVGFKKTIEKDNMPKSLS